MCYEDLSQQDISEAMAIPKQTVNLFVANLLKNRYVYFENIPQSRGKKIIRLMKSWTRLRKKSLSAFSKNQNLIGKKNEIESITSAA